MDVEVNASGFSKEIQELDAMLDEINNDKNNNNSNDNCNDEQTDELNGEEEKKDQACSINKDIQKEKTIRNENLNE